MKRMKKWLALMLAACMTFPSVTGFTSDLSVVHAAEAAEQSLIYETSDVQITQGSAVDITANLASAAGLDEGTIIVKFTSTSNFAVQSLFSISNSSAGNKDRHFHIYVTPGGRLGCEIRNTNSVMNYHMYADGAIKSGSENVIAFKADKTSGQYKMYANGLLVKTVEASTLGGYKFVDQITGVDNVQIGATKRNGAQQYTFGGTVHSLQVYSTALDDETILAAVNAGDVQLGGAISTMFDASMRDNTWAFVGGEAVQGGFDQTRGIRNYIGQFEEYIRWTIGGSSPINGRQRFTFNFGKAGRTLDEIVENYETLVAQYKTKAAVYMVGVEDYSQGEAKLADFKADLKSFIDKSLALKDNNGFAVIQTPFAVKDDAVNAVIEKYCAAVDEVVESYKTNAQKYSHIVVADHFEATNTADFKANKLQENGKLNAQGHLEIGKQFALATCDVSGTFPRDNVSLNRAELDQPSAYLDVQPTATAEDTALKVVIPAVEGVTSWKYELDMDGTVVTGTADANEFKIADLVKDAAYVLKIQSEDGEKQLVTIKGVIAKDNVSKKNVQEDLDANQQKIADLVAGEDSVTWLFMGDSITHACQFTAGYDGIAQAFDKFVKEELGRTDDVVLNTAVSNANTATTVQELDQRLKNYTPDVVSIMLGTNDCSSRVPEVTVEIFEKNMKTVLDAIKEKNPDAVIILRSMTPVFNDSNRSPYMPAYMNVVKSLAKEYSAIYVDQYTALKAATDTYTWLPASMFPDNLHPDGNTHRVMFQQFLKACGLWTEDSVMTNLFYDLGIAKENNAMKPEILVGADKLGVNVGDLNADSGLSFGDVTVKATSVENGQSYEVTVKQGKSFAVVRNLPGESTYDVEVSGYLTNAKKEVVFAAQQVTLSDDADFEEEAVLLKAGSISVSEETMTEEQPLAAGTAGSALFRIPALITLDNGDLLAAADARWTTSADWGGLDTIASVSSDNGKTWYYSFPIYFPDSNTKYPGMEVATTAIDPVLVQGHDGTIYCIADMNPSGITTGDIMPAYGTGFVEIDGQWRLALTGTYTKPNENNEASYGNPAEYEYYVGDFDENGFAPVLRQDDHSATEWGVDEWYNIYTINAETGAYEATLTQTMVNDPTVIQQNAFYKDSVLHVFNTGYLWMVTSTDNGRTWGNPTILNTQIKRSTDRALLASPGQGIAVSNGDIVIPFYDHGDGQENASVIWSSDNGQTWTRSNDVSGMWSSESEVVELHNGVLRMFYRNGTGKICYSDITKTDGEWIMGAGVQTNIDVCSTCNVSAIRHSQKVNGKTAVMVACPGGSGRNNGKIFTFLVDEDNSMELFNTFSVNEGAYAYSCVTELADGSIGLLWEDAAASIRYDGYTLNEILGYEKNIVIDPEEVYVEERNVASAAEITQKPNKKIATVTSEYVLEESKIVLHDHVSNTDSSLTSFNAAAGTATVDEAEFTFTASGSNWKIYNETKGVYLTNESAASTFFSSAAADMKVTAVDGEFRISKADGQRYIIFHNPNMDFNSNRDYNANLATGSYELVLLEKQDSVSETDIVPGYKQVSEITSGKNYLIAYIWTDGSVIVLYPTNGTAAQTKLVGGANDIAKNVITITGVAPGQTSAVIGDVTYNITVKDPSESPTYAGNDLPTDGIKVTAGSLEPSEGSLEALLDGVESTFYHSNWSGTRPTDKDFWITLELPEVTKVAGMRYLPRQNSSNGRILEYVISYSLDGEEWTEAVSGKWANDTTWKKASFDGVEAKYVKIFATDSVADNSGRHLTGAELRVVKATEPVEPPVAEVDKSRLESLINGAATDSETYTEESWAVFAAAIEAGKAVLADEDATQEEVDAAYKAIFNAALALKKKPAEPNPPVVEEEEVVRLFGSGRYETGYAVADALKEVLGVEKFEAVVVTTGKNFADALAGSYLAVEKNAAILLTNGKDDNIAQLHAYIKENVVEGGKVYILGGEAAVPAAVEAMEGYDVVRLFGDSRYDTNLAILAEAGVSGDSVIVATGKTFADSLSASAAKLPILLVKPNAALNDAQKEILADMKNIYIVGGEGAVSAAYAEELAAYGEVTRVFGDSRYDTSVEIAKTFCTDADKAVVASGKNFPDGLCGGPLAAALNAPLILTKDGGAAAAAGYVADNAIASGFVLGGDGALTDDTVVEVFGLESAEEIVLK